MPGLSFLNLKSERAEAGSTQITGNARRTKDYRYQHVTTGVLLDDFRFSKSAPKAGDLFPDFDLLTTDGERIRRSYFLGRKPLLMVFGSVTCPMTASSIAPLRRLNAEFGNRIEFVTLNVREAHPAENFEQPNTFEQKLRHAVALKKRFEIPWTVAIDDIVGTLHRSLDTKPNAAFLMDKEGRIVFRSLWAGDERALKDALDSVASSRHPEKSQSIAMLAPMARGIGFFQDVLEQAGPRAAHEMLFAAPPIAIAGKIAGLFQRLAPDKRWALSIVTIDVSLIAALGTAVGLLG